MTTHASISVKGLDEYIKRLDQAGVDIDKAAEKAIRAGANVLRRGMRRRAPKLTGRLRDHIRVKYTREGGRFTARVGLIHEREYTPADVARYGNVQEYGSATTPAHPFIRPTIQEDASEVYRVMKKTLEESGLV